jgi:hypothetical protein
MKKIALVLAIAAAAFVFASANHVDAACYSSYGKVFYIYSNNVHASSNYGYIYITPHTTLPTYCYYYYTNNKEALAAIAAAQAAGKTVYAWGSASSCPSSGTYRYGGVLYGFRIYSNR